MRKYENILELIANDFLYQNSSPIVRKPNYSNRDFLNAIIIFQQVLMDKMYDNQDFDKMDMKERLKMTSACGDDLKKLIHTYTGLNTHKIEDFLK